MERLFVSVLTIVTLVTATPHGYGVKGGASAKAEASAVAGGFGDLGPIPLSIPSGAGYSGSFSKSSASSFASSSASSSASSYSFSGSGANGIAGIGNKGCSSGACPVSGASEPVISGVHPITGANAVSAAQAKAQSGSYTPCQGSNCHGSPAEKCTSGQCSSDLALKGQNGCSGNGNCQSPSSETDLSNDGSSDKGEKDKQGENNDNSNDFAVNINRNSQSKLSHDANGQYSNKEKSYYPESDCSQGKCGQANFDQSHLGNNHNQYPVPSTHLTTPSKDPPCTTPNCNYPSQGNGPQTGGLPSSYNVPIQSATNPPNTYYSSPSDYSSVPNQKNNLVPAVPCTSPACNSAPHSVGTPKVPNYNFEQQGSNNQGPCASGQCNSPSALNGKTNNGALPGATAPNYSLGNIPSNVPFGHSVQPGCTTSLCASGLPTYSSLPTNPPGNGCSGTSCSGTPVTGSPAKPSDSNAPIYTGGFGGPAGFLDISSGSNKLTGNSAHNYGHNTPGTSKPNGAYGSSPVSSGTNNQNELNSNNNYGSTQTSSNGGFTGSFENNKPSSVPSTPGSHFNPSASSSYGTPITSSIVPLGSNPHSENNGIYKPTTSHTATSPTYSGGIHGSTGSSHTNSGSNSIHGSFGVTKPNVPSSSFSSPAYTGGFGGPSGIISGSTQPVGPTGSFNKPGYGNCGSAACDSQSGANVGGGSTLYDKINPSTSTSSQNKPLYNGGFGGPAGLLNPNNYNAPSNTPTVSSGNIPCANGNCGPKNTPSSSQGSSISGAHSLAAATATADAIAYSGGFGGPPGVLKPYDEGKVNIPAHGNLANGHGLSSPNGHPNTPSGSSGSSTNGANAVAHASATASATAGSYGGNHNNGASHGCNSGCSPNGPYDGNSGATDGLIKNGLGAASIASAKSDAGANAHGIGGSFATSSASAHASASAATKGGYGRK